ncbi:MAG: hypothetical protein Q8P90_02695 [bacterium]|nr:hypothetical protein [bacterium]
MKQNIITILFLSSLLLLAGCTIALPADVDETTVEANTNETSNDNILEITDKTDAVENLNVNEEVDEVDAEEHVLNKNEDWQTYTNEEYGFSFEYPDHFYSNYSSQDKLPLNRITISDAPKERAEDEIIKYIYSELVNERAEIESAQVDNNIYKALNIDAIAKETINVEGGGGIVNKYTWYDDDYKYSLSFVFPPNESIEKSFRSEYSNSTKIDKFIEDVKQGTAPTEYQLWFDEFDTIMQTLQSI